MNGSVKLSNLIVSKASIKQGLEMRRQDLQGL
jgi:hypothetical protein